MSAYLERYGERYGLLVVWGIVVAVFSLLLPDTFFTLRNFTTMFGSQSVLVLLTLALLLPLTSADYDLSAASVLTLGAMIVAVLNVQLGWPLWAAIPAALASGMLVGLLNGALIVVLGIESLIVTLGTGTLVAGLVLFISGSNTIYGIDQWLVDAVIVPHLLGLPNAFFYGLLAAAVVWYLLEFTPMGRQLLFVGRSRRVARLNGLRVGALRWKALVAASTLSAFAGVIYAGTSGAADPSSGGSLLLPAFAGAFLGSTAISPGRFNPWGSFFAVYFLVTGITGLSLFGAHVYVQNLFYGSALIVAVALAQFTRRREAGSTDRT